MHTLLLCSGNFSRAERISNSILHMELPVTYCVSLGIEEQKRTNVSIIVTTEENVTRSAGALASHPAKDCPPCCGWTEILQEYSRYCIIFICIISCLFWFIPGIVSVVFFFLQLNNDHNFSNMHICYLKMCNCIIFSYRQLGYSCCAMCLLHSFQNVYSFSLKDLYI